MSLVPAGIDWVDPAGYAHVETQGRAGLAWEFMRRDPAYHRAHAAAKDRAGALLDGAFTARWGLHFRL